MQQKNCYYEMSQTMVLNNMELTHSVDVSTGKLSGLPMVGLVQSDSQRQRREGG